MHTSNSTIQEELQWWIQEFHVKVLLQPHNIKRAINCMFEQTNFISLLLFFSTIDLMKLCMLNLNLVKTM